MERFSEVARARLAYISAGQPTLGGARRAARQPEQAGQSGKAEQSERAGGVEHIERADGLSEADAPAPEGVGGSPFKLGIARPVVTGKHLIVVALLLVAAVAVTLIALGGSAATEVPLLPSVPAAPTPPPSAAPESTPSPTPAVLRVHVAGAVASPGVVRVRDGTIVQDAIAAAGGLTADADPADLNLAAPVTDGMQIRIGTTGHPLGEVNGTAPTGGAGSSATPGGPLDLNTASQAQLEDLPGVGPVMASAIIAWREEHGRFTAVEELQEIDGVGPKTFQRLAPLVTT